MLTRRGLALGRPLRSAGDFELVLVEALRNSARTLATWVFWASSSFRLPLGVRTAYVTRASSLQGRLPT